MLLIPKERLDVTAAAEDVKHRYVFSLDTVDDDVIPNRKSSEAGDQHGFLTMIIAGKRREESRRGSLRACATVRRKQSVCCSRGADTRVCRVGTRADARLVRNPG